jgi:hypothetical protein
MSVLTQEPAQHDRLKPVQVFPVQQASPKPPHDVLPLVWQVPAVHDMPELQAEPAQHAWPAPPQTGAVSHLFATQTRPDAQELPVQQSWRNPPHAVGDAHVPRSHT